MGDTATVVPVGPPTQRAGKRQSFGEAEVAFPGQARIRIRTGDHVLVSSGTKLPWVGLVEEMWRASASSKMQLRLLWHYRAAELDVKLFPASARGQRGLVSERLHGQSTPT